MIRFTPAEFATRCILLYAAGYGCAIAGVLGGAWWPLWAVVSVTVAMWAWGSAKVKRVET